MNSKFVTASLCLLVSFFTIQSSAAELIRVFSTDSRPLFALQLIQTGDSLEQHLYKFNRQQSAYEIKLSPEQIKIDFSDTTFELSSGFQLVLPAPGSFARSPELIHKGTYPSLNDRQIETLKLTETLANSDQAAQIHIAQAGFTCAGLFN